MGNGQGASKNKGFRNYETCHLTLGPVFMAVFRQDRWLILASKALHLF